MRCGYDSLVSLLWLFNMLTLFTVMWCSTRLVLNLSPYLRPLFLLNYNGFSFIQIRYSDIGVQNSFMSFKHNSQITVRSQSTNSGHFSNFNGRNNRFVGCLYLLLLVTLMTLFCKMKTDRHFSILPHSRSKSYTKCTLLYCILLCVTEQLFSISFMPS